MKKELTPLEKTKKKQALAIKILDIIGDNSKNDQEYFINLLAVQKEISLCLSNFEDIFEKETIDK